MTKYQVKSLVELAVERVLAKKHCLYILYLRPGCATCSESIIQSYLLDHHLETSDRFKFRRALSTC